MNGSFTYQAYDKDRFVRNIQVGEENPMFTPLNRISDYLVKSVLQSEDPSFMLHRGFLPEAFRESIVKNYKERRFARGGSTISMQLVKNVFLPR
ncbi:MAG: transglycosylase domain-containing protein [Chitinophagaceae bacterium]|nr:transglycosylase domain-containing protein [Chitinophagaceae bacterium]